MSTNLAAEAWIRGNIPEAMQAARRAIQIAPDGPLGYRRAGRIKWTSGALAEAVGFYRKSLELAPDDTNSIMELGSLLVDLGIYDEAEELLDEHRYLVYLAQGRVQDALSITRASLKQRPDHIGTIVAAARTELRTGHYEQVLELLEPMAEDSDTVVPPLFQPYGVHFWDPQIAAMDLAVARLESGKEEAGLALLSEVKEHFEHLRDEGLDHPILDLQQARILTLEGNQQEALSVLRKVIGAGLRFWYLETDPALRSLHDNREFRSIVGDRDRLVEIELEKLLKEQ